MTQFPYNIIITLACLMWLFAYMRYKVSLYGFHWYLLFCFLSECIQTSYRVDFFKIPGINQCFFGHTYLFIQFTYMSYLIFNEVANVIIRLVIQTIMFVVSCFILWQLRKYGMNDVFEKMYFVPLSLTLCLFCFLFFIDRLLKPQYIMLLKDTIFFLVLAQLLWSVFAIFNFGSLYLFDITDSNYSRFFAKAFNWINVATYFIYLFAILCRLYLKI